MDVRKTNIFTINIAARMTKAGFDRTFDQCRLKVKILRGEYRKVKDGNNKTAEDRK